jgi:hypothetical protein
MSHDHQQHQNGNDFVLLDAVAWCRITSALFSCCAAAAAELCLYSFVSFMAAFEHHRHRRFAMPHILEKMFSRSLSPCHRFLY